MRRPVILGVALLTCAIVAAGCGADPGGTDTTAETSVAEDPCAHVIAAELVATDSTYRVSVTVRSDDTGWDKYADAWEVRTADGSVLGTRVLANPHESEQPFTRSLDGVVIPNGLTEVVIAARDSVAGFCGDTLTVQVPA